jgi:hypothetical protein
MMTTAKQIRTISRHIFATLPEIDKIAVVIRRVIADLNSNWKRYFIEQAATVGVDLTDKQAQDVINMFRNHYKINTFSKRYPFEDLMEEVILNLTENNWFQSYADRREVTRSQVTTLENQLKDPNLSAEEKKTIQDQIANKTFDTDTFKKLLQYKLRQAATNILGEMQRQKRDRRKEDYQPETPPDANSESYSEEKVMNKFFNNLEKSRKELQKHENSISLKNLFKEFEDYLGVVGKPELYAPFHDYIMNDKSLEELTEELGFDNAASVKWILDKAKKQFISMLKEYKEYDTVYEMVQDAVQ